jgi:hypothetical protein
VSFQYWKLIIFLDFTIEQNTEIHEKYANLIDLLVEMMSPKKADRPDCRKLLLKRESWALNFNDHTIDIHLNAKKARYSPDCFHTNRFIEIKSNK